MGEEIKSAREIALGKIKKLGDATEEERLRWKYVPEGEKLSVRYLNQEVDLAAELGKYEDKIRKCLAKGAAEILLRNIKLPQNEADIKQTTRAMDGIKILKTDKAAAENVFGNIRRIFEHYQGQGDQQMSQAYQSLKADFTANLQAAMKQQYGSVPDVDINVESQPQFQEEWRKVKAEMNSQYLKLLAEYKEALAAIE
ncbi:MAG: hypothetical protein V3R92_04050 [Dehalococcoidales bacterium]